MSTPLIAQDASAGGTSGSQSGTADPSPGGGDREPTDPETLIIIGDEASEGSVARPVVGTWDFVKMLLVLGGVVGVIYLLFMLIKRGGRGRSSDNRLIRILDTQALTGHRGLYLVGVGDSVYLVGSAESGVSLISEITDRESLDVIKLELAEKGPSDRRSFASYLLDFFRTGERNEVSVVDSLGFMQRQKERLKKLRQ